MSHLLRLKLNNLLNLKLNNLKQNLEKPIKPKTKQPIKPKTKQPIKPKTNKKVSFKEQTESDNEVDKVKKYREGYDPLGRNAEDRDSVAYPLPMISQRKYNHQDYMKYPFMFDIPRVPIQQIYNLKQSETHLGNDFITKAFIETLPGRYKPLEFNMIKNRKRLNDMLYGLIDIKKVDNVLNLSTNIIGNNWREFLLVDKPNPYGTEDASNKDLPKNFL